MKHLITLKQWTKEEILEVLSKAIEIKKNKERYFDVLKGKSMIMLFEKTSTRTRLSFEIGMTQLGGHSVFVDARTTQLSIGSDFKDEIKAMMRYCDILMYRAKKAENVFTAANQNMVPVIDACSEKYHPCQTIGDLLTMAEHSGGIENVKKIVWLGIENNVSNTLKLACAKLGIKMVFVAPKIHAPSVDEELNRIVDASGMVSKTDNLQEAMMGADYVHTDTWIDMEFFKDGKVLPEFQEEYDKRIAMFKPLQINAKLLELNPATKIMHCMPCHIDYEISRDAVDHPNAVIFDQAENRMHAQKAIILKLLGK